MCVAQKAPGDPGFALPVMLKTGRAKKRRAKVLRAEVLAGMLLEMGTGAKSAPKGGLTRLIEAAEARKHRPEASGKFGEGAYKDEPWSIVALRKRVYSMRRFYVRSSLKETVLYRYSTTYGMFVVPSKSYPARGPVGKSKVRTIRSIVQCISFTHRFPQERGRPVTAHTVLSLGLCVCPRTP